MQFCTMAARGDCELGAVRSLHLSLNAPVIAIDELPVGPARAGVALCLLPEGGLHLQIAIRSLRTGEVVTVASDLDAEGPPEEVAAVEAALSYAEGMGFLFDEDEVANGGSDAAAKAAALWRDLVEAVPERARTSESAAVQESRESPDAGDPVCEVAVQDSVSDAETIVVEYTTAVEIEPPAETLASAPPASLLTKFRLVLDGNGPGREPAAAELLRESRIRLLSRY